MYIIYLVFFLRYIIPTYTRYKIFSTLAINSETVIYGKVKPVVKSIHRFYLIPIKSLVKQK